MSRLCVAHLFGSWLVLEMEFASVTQYYPTPLPDRETAEVFRAFIAKYRETSIVDPPSDLQFLIADRLARFLSGHWLLGDGIATPQEILDAFLSTEDARMAMRPIV